MWTMSTSEALVFVAEVAILMALALAA